MKTLLGFEPKWSAIPLQRFGIVLLGAPALWALAAAKWSPSMLGATLMVGGDPLWREFPLFSFAIQLFLLAWASGFICLYGHLIMRIAAHYGPWRAYRSLPPDAPLPPSPKQGLILPFVFGLILPATALWFSLRHGVESWPSRTFILQLTVGVASILAGSAAVYAVRRVLVGVFQSSRVQGLGLKFFNRRFFGDGYIVDGKPGGHVRMLGAWLFGLAVYLVALVFASPHVLGPSLVPAAFYGMLIFFLLLTVMAALGFYFDRWHVPSLGILLVVWIIAGVFGWPPDHFYATQSLKAGASGEDPRLGSVVVGWAKPSSTAPRRPSRYPTVNGKRTLVIVTAAGGGIQASAWTARVLVGLHEMYGANFTDSVGVVSAVSGGSVGTMFYLANWRNLRESAKGVRQPAGQWIVDNATASSLEATAWGLAGYDALRAFVPVAAWSWMGDRGTALEGSWKNRLRDKSASPGDLGKVRTDLRRLVTSTDATPLPIPIFNATLAETGQRFAFAPARFLSPPQPASADEFARLYPESDVDATTAVRLSASFSFVSPISRPSRDGSPLTQGWVADGGYADNEGLAAAVDALKAIQLHCDLAGEQPFDRVLILRISAFPDPEFAPADGGGGSAPFAMGGDDRPFRSVKGDQSPSDLSTKLAAARFGWRQAAQGPFDLLQQARVSVQAERNGRELALWHNLMPLVPQTVGGESVVETQVVKQSAAVQYLAKAAATRPAAARPPIEKPREPAGLRDELRRRALRGDLERSGREGGKFYQAATAAKEGAAKPKPFQLLSVKLNYAPKDPDEQIPLSWRLTPMQQRNLDEAWERLKDRFDEPFAFNVDDEPIKGNSLDELFGGS